MDIVLLEGKSDMKIQLNSHIQKFKIFTSKCKKLTKQLAIDLNQHVEDMILSACEEDCCSKINESIIKILQFFTKLSNQQPLAWKSTQYINLDYVVARKATEYINLDYVNKKLGKKPTKKCKRLKKNAGILIKDTRLEESSDRFSSKRASLMKMTMMIFLLKRI